MINKFLYILDDDGNPKSATGHEEWAQWFVKANRTIAHTSILNVNVSTIFLGINHNFALLGPPVLWETMIFANPTLKPINQMQWRYSSKLQALNGHKHAVRIVKRIVHN